MYTYRNSITRACVQKHLIRRLLGPQPSGHAGSFSKLLLTPLDLVGGIARSPSRGAQTAACARGRGFRSPPLGSWWTASLKRPSPPYRLEARLPDGIPWDLLGGPAAGRAGAPAPGRSRPRSSSDSSGGPAGLQPR